jgi:hypothetical protein
MTYDEAKEKLSTFPLKYVIIGFKSDGRRGIPPTYEMGIEASSEQTVFDDLKKFQEARVFSIAEIGTPDHWKQKMKNYFDKKAEQEEKELLNKLKKKYPNE